MSQARPRRNRTSFSVSHDMLTCIRARSASLCLPVATYLRLIVWNDQAEPAANLGEVWERIPPAKHVQTPFPYELPSPLRTWAAARAQKHGLDQSAYLVALIQLDLERGGPLTVACVKPPSARIP